MSAKLQQVHVRVNDAATGKPTPCRVRFTDAEGRYYAPYGRTARFPVNRDHDVAGSLCFRPKVPSLLEGEIDASLRQLLERRTPIIEAYIDGACEIALPPGLLHVNIRKGPEYERIDKQIELQSGKLALRFELHRLLNPAGQGWHAGVLAQEALSPHEILLEGAAEGLRVVDLLAYERVSEEDAEGACIEYPNLLAFSGQQPCLETPECLVAVNTSNRHRALGGLALLNCHRPVFPLWFGLSNQDRSAFDNWTLADWCDQCHRKKGLVIAPNVSWWEKWSGGEGLADLILGKIDAVGLGEMHVESIQWWYTLLALGLRAPIVAGIPSRPLALIARTYVRVPRGEALTYSSWIEAMRAGRTVVSDGPFLTLSVNGEDPGLTIDLPATGGVVRVRAEAKSRDAFQQLEIVQDGKVVATNQSRHDALFHAVVETEIPVTQSGWIAARCTTKPYPNVHRLDAHTSPVYLRVDHQPPPADPVAVETVTGALDRTLAWVEHEAQCETAKDRQRLASVFLQAKQVLLRKLEP